MIKQKIVKIVIFVMLFIITIACDYKRVIIDSTTSRHDKIRNSISGENTAEAHIGEFIIKWGLSNDKYINISRMENQNRVIWETVKDQSFVWARLVETEFEEYTGSFSVKENEKKFCHKQSIEKIYINDNEIKFEGMLESDRWFWQKPTRIKYTLSFKTTAYSNQLSFDVKVYPENNYISKKEVWRVGLVTASDADERIYGFGEQFTYLNQKGKKLPILVQEQGHGRGIQPLSGVLNRFGGNSAGHWYTSYASVPHYITSKAKSLFLENYEYSIFDMTDEDKICIEVDAERMKGRILNGKNPLDLIEEYTIYSGRMKALPDWVNQGAIVGLQGGSTLVRENLKRLELYDTPISAVWMQDWVGQRSTVFAKRLWWNWEIDRESYPDFEELLKELSNKNLRSLGYINPFLVDVSEKESARHNFFSEAKERGYLIVDAKTGKPKLIDSAGFKAAMVDLSNENARNWLKEIIKSQLIDVGFSGWMSDFSEALPYDTAPHSGESPKTFHHKYVEEWAKLNQEVVQEAGLEDEILYFLRSGYSRSPGYASLFWAGDQLVSWDEYDGIKSALTGLISGGFSGFSLNHSDIGGCIDISFEPIVNFKRTKELLVRWMEMNAFTAVYRNHEGNNPLTNGHQIYSDDDTIKYFAKFAKIYKALASYRKTLIEQAESQGYPVVRHPILHYFDDENVYDLQYQFMLGSEFMIAPVLDESTDHVDVYLPEGRWVHLWTGKNYGNVEKGTLIKNIMAPMGYPAVFYKKNSPWGEELKNKLKEMGVLEQSDNYSGHGLYWYGYENNRQKFISGEYNPFYDPQKPVVIFGHGHKPGSAVTRDVIYFRCATDVCKSDDVSYIHQDWIDAGYNVGVFDWTAYADEKEVKFAESKLWSTNGPGGMRYRLPSGNYVDQKIPGTSLIDEMANIYEEAIKDNINQEIRFVGFSLGAQLITGVAYRVHKDIINGTVSDEIMPSRLSFLDPAWTKNGKEYLGDLNEDGELDWTGERTRWAVAEMNENWEKVNDFVVDMYHSTQLDSGIVGDNNQPIYKHVAGPVRIFMDYINITGVDKKHMAVKTYYFFSFSASQPREVDHRGEMTGVLIPSARADNLQLLMNEESGSQWVQYGGKTTISIDDDTFLRR